VTPDRRSGGHRLLGRSAVLLRMTTRLLHEERAAPGSTGVGVRAASARVQLRLLPTFGLEIDGAPRRVPAGAQRLLAYLALQDAPVLRATAAGVLWVGSSEEHAHACLRSTIWRLGRCGVPLVTAGRDVLGLGDRLEVDLRQVIDGARRLIADPRRCDVATLDARSLSVDLLVGWYDDWVLLEQERLRQLRVHALEALSRQLAAEGHFGRAVDAAFAAVQAEPLRETAHRTLMEAYLAEGNVAKAIQQYRRFAELLARALGIAPSASLQRMAAEITVSDRARRSCG
jgi:DNA-binding SARP family transcriptional activator